MADESKGALSCCCDTMLGVCDYILLLVVVFVVVVVAAAGNRVAMRAEFGAPIVDVALLPNCCELLHRRRSIDGAIARLTRDSSSDYLRRLAKYATFSERKGVG
jgi:hypothetical protein